MVLAACQHQTVTARKAPVQESQPVPQVAAPPPEPAPVVLAPPPEPVPPPALAGPPPMPGVARVALLLPLTGRSAELGQALLDAAQMALFDVRADDLVLMPKDTNGTPEGAARAAATAIAEGATLIIGPLFAGSVASVAPLARSAGVNVVAFSSERSVAGPGVFIMGLLPEQQIARAAAGAGGPAADAGRRPGRAAAAAHRAFGRARPGCASHLSHPGCIKNADRSAGTGDGTIFAVRRA